jgi:hypothetical protein
MVQINQPRRQKPVGQGDINRDLARQNLGNHAIHHAHRARPGERPRHK